MNNEMDKYIYSKSFDGNQNKNIDFGIQFNE